MWVQYGLGIVLAVAVAGGATATGLDRRRGFYPAVLVVIAVCYALFAAMAAPRSVLLTESFIAVGFALLAVAGFRASLWLVAAGLAGHGAFDLIHHRFIDNPGVPSWWPALCLAFDVTLGAAVALILVRRRG